jgi:hypothetical protein
MNRSNLAIVGSSLLLGLLVAFQTGAQGQSGGARPRAPQAQAPSRMPQDKAFGEKGDAASSSKATNSSAADSAHSKSAGAADCAAAKAAIAAAGTGGTTGEGQGGTAGADGRAKAAATVCSEVPAEAGKSSDAPQHAEDGLKKARSDQKSDGAPDARKTPEQKPPQ